jgi:phosphatidylglycerophosphatase A
MAVQAPSLSLRTRLAVAIATVGGLGRSPLAPGTVASAVTAVVLWLVNTSPLGLAVALVAVTALGIWAADASERTLGGKDPGSIVIDEVAGMILAVLAAPPTPLVLVVAFVLFRLFDVLKPFPANIAQSLRGGVGVMVDDLVAGLYALVLVVLARSTGWL